MEKFPVIYGMDSPEYNQVLEDTRAAVKAHNLRNRYTVAKSKGLEWEGKIPPRPTPWQYQLMKYDQEWKAVLHSKPEEWWFDRINEVVEEKFYRAKVHCLVWWDLCEKQRLDYEAWHERMEGYDFDRDLECDWELVEYALHCIGYPPLKARQMCFETKDRKKWKAHRRLVYKCFECDDERTNLNYPPLRCKACGKTGTMEQL